MKNQRYAQFLDLRRLQYAIVALDIAQQKEGIKPVNAVPLWKKQVLWFPAGQVSSKQDNTDC